MRNEITTDELKNSTPYSMRGLTYTAMPLGAIRLGHAIDLPSGQKELIRADEFRVTQPLREKDGTWIADEIDAKLRERSKKMQRSTGSAQAKLQAIPVRMHVNDPSLIVQSGLEAFDLVTKRSVCVSSGAGTAKRWSGSTGTTDVECVGCDRCTFANSGSVACKFLGRISVQIEGQDSDLGTYILRTGSFNTIKTFEAKLRQYNALFGALRGLPFVMKLREAQTELSGWSSFFMVDLELDNVSFKEAAKLVKETAEEDARSGLNFELLAQVMHDGLLNGGYIANSAEDGVDLSEFLDSSKTMASAQVSAQKNAMSVQTDQDYADHKVALEKAHEHAVKVVEQVISRASGGGVYIPDFDPVKPAAKKEDSVNAESAGLKDEDCPDVGTKDMQVPKKTVLAGRRVRPNCDDLM